MNDNLPANCLSAYRQAAIRLHNSLRVKHSAPALIEENQLNLASHAYAQQLAITNKLLPSQNRVNTGENLFVTYSSIPLTAQICERKSKSKRNLNLSF